MQRRNLFVLRYNGRDDNLGDQFIFQGLIDALSRFGPVFVRGKRPVFMDPLQRSGCDALLALSVAMRWLRGYSVHSVQPPGGRTWTKSTSANGSDIGLKRQLLDSLLDSRIVIGTSVIPAADHSWGKQFDWIGVRDQESLTALRAHGMQQAEYFPDLAFLATISAANDVGRNRVVFSFRSTLPELVDDSSYGTKLTHSVGKVVNSVGAETRKFTEIFHQVDEDAEFNNRLSKAFCIPRLSQRLTLQSYPSFYNGAKWVISNRLHCLLIGASCGALPIALTSRRHTKLNALFETVGWSSLMLAIEDVDGLVERFYRIQSESPNLTAMVKSTFESQHQLALGILSQRYGEPIC
jgi:hypothetical protein